VSKARHKGVFKLMGISGSEDQAGRGRVITKGTPKTLDPFAAGDDSEFRLFKGGFFCVRTSTRRFKNPVPEMRGSALTHQFKSP